MRIWFGMVNVEFEKENEFFPEDNGGYVNVISQAKSKGHFIEKVNNALLAFSFDIVAFKDVEVFDEKIKHDSPDETIFELYNQAKNSDEVFFGVFHTYYEP